MVAADAAPSLALALPRMELEQLETAMDSREGFDVAPVIAGYFRRGSALVAADDKDPGPDGIEREESGSLGSRSTPADPAAEILLIYGRLHSVKRS